MASPKRRAGVVTLDRLSASITEAIELAAQRQKVSAASPNLIGHGQIMGRLTEHADVKAAFAIAEVVTAKVNKIPGVDAVPALLRLDRGILMGFIDRSSTLRQFGES